MPLIPLAEAQRYVSERCGRLDPRVVPVADALGLVAAEVVRSSEQVPGFANTAMDGYAVRATDTVGAPVVLRVIDTLLAGRATERIVGRGEAIRIMTGAPMPSGADAVVMVERTRAEGETVTIEIEVRAGEAVRSAGSDIEIGDEVVAVGTPMGPAAVGVLHSVGASEVVAWPRTRVGVLSTGDELVTGGQPLAAGQIRDSNRPALIAAVREAGADPVDLGCIPDDAEAIEAAFRAGAAECDAVVSSGGVSMGDVDLVKVVLDRIADMRWMQIAIKPAKPFAFGVLDTGEGRSVPLFGLPGNPVSSLVSFELLARPSIRRMMGAPRPERRRVLAIAGAALGRRPDGKTHFVRVIVDQDDAHGFVVRPAGGQGSHQLAAMVTAGGLAELPDGPGVDAGASVDVILLS